MSKVKKFSIGKRQLRKGFTLAEVLIVVVIIGILSAFTGVGAVSMYRNMKQTQLDKTAELIFHAAQDRLSEIYAYGREDIVEKVPDGNVIDSDNKVVFIKSGESSDANTAIMSNGIVSGDIFNNYWVIEYQASTCRVLNVLYSEGSQKGLGGFGAGVNESIDTNALVTALKGKKFSKDERKNKYGWYGDNELDVTADKQIANTSVDVDIINEENLYAHVKVTVGWENDISDVDDLLGRVKITTSLKNADVPNANQFELSSVTAKQIKDKSVSETHGYYNIHPESDTTKKIFTASWDVLLDSLYDGAFTGDSKDEKRTFAANGSGIPAGSNFYLIVKMESDNSAEGTPLSIPTVQDYDLDNSLFAGYSADSKTAYIEYGRHLQNIAKAEISGLKAVQIADLDFNAATATTRAGDLDEFNKYWSSVYPDTDDGFTNYAPGNSGNLVSYDGQNHIIKNLDINKAISQESAGSFSGIFGNLSAIANVKNIIIKDSTVNAGANSNNSGMFAGMLSGESVVIENCYLHNVSVYGNSATASLGGFAGNISASVDAKNSGMFLVNVGKTSADDTSASATCAASGAFAGKSSAKFEGTNLCVVGGEISAKKNAGGLIGSSETSPADTTFSLAGCKISGVKISSIGKGSENKGDAGGFLGSASNNKLDISIGSDSSVAGCIIKSEEGNAGGFIGGSYAGITIEDSEYFIPGSDADKDKVAAEINQEFADVINLSSTTVSFNDVHGLLGSNPEFYIDELKGDKSISDMQWISGGADAGGLVGYSTMQITVNDSFAAGVISAATNAGGFVGNTSGTLSVTCS